MEKDLLSIALNYATEKHNGQKRKGGMSYIFHPMSVARLVGIAGFGLKYQIAALLHDVLEDTDATEEELRTMFGEEIAKAVVCLTRSKGEDMALYVSRVKTNTIATVVKNADIINNLSDCVYADDGIAKNGEENKGRKWIRKFVNKAKDYYAGQFSAAVDSCIDNVLSLLNSEKVLKYTFTPILPSIESMRLNRELMTQDVLKEYVSSDSRFFRLTATSMLICITPNDTVWYKQKEENAWKFAATTKARFEQDLAENEWLYDIAPEDVVQELYQSILNA